MHGACSTRVGDWTEMHTTLGFKKLNEKLRGRLINSAVKPLKWIVMKVGGDDVV